MDYKTTPDYNKIIFLLKKVALDDNIAPADTNIDVRAL